MKSTRNSIFMLYTALCLIVLGMIAGCSDRSSDCGPDAGGTGGGRNCTWNPADAGVPIPDCSHARITAHFVGTLDGKPVDQIFDNDTTAIDPIMNEGTSQGLSVILPSKGYFNLWWVGPTSSDEWIDVGGALRFPDDETPREVKYPSRFRFTCGGFLYQYVLELEGGQLTACSVN